MSETVGYDPIVEATREKLGSDGHLVENALAFIAATAAEGRGSYSNPGDAIFGMIDALVGKRSKVLPEIVYRMKIFHQVLGDEYGEIAKQAVNAGYLALITKDRN